MCIWQCYTIFIYLVEWFIYHVIRHWGPNWMEFQKDYCVIIGSKTSIRCLNRKNAKNVVMTLSTKKGFWGWLLSYYIVFMRNSDKPECVCFLYVEMWVFSTSIKNLHENKSLQHTWMINGLVFNYNFCVCFCMIYVLLCTDLRS